MFSGDVSEVIRTYSGATRIPALYINTAGNAPCYLPQQLDYEALINYFDFREILGFVKYFFRQNSRDGSGLTTYHTFYTKNYFIYNIVFTSKFQNTTGAIISGPFLIYLPDERRIEEIMAYNKIPLHKKPELREILNSLPLASMEQIDHSGRLLLALCASDIKSWTSSQPVIRGQMKTDIETVFDKLTGAGGYDSEKNTVYRRLYKFAINLKKGIIHGNTDELSELLDKSIDVLWSAEASRDIFNTLKSNCMILCTLSCIYAIQGKAPVELMMHLQYEFLEKIELLKTADEIVSFMMTVTRTYAHAVSVLTDNTYSMHVNRALQYIKTHYMEDITLETLANHVHINHVYLSGLIKKETKLSLSDNINNIRIAQSKNLLIYTNKSLNEIAHAVGYNYQNHFSLMFKKFSGITPFEFRRKYGQYL